MVHFRAASWYKEAVEKQNYKKISPEKWLERNRRYWYDPNNTCSEKVEEASVPEPVEKPERKKPVSPKSIISLRNNGASSRKIYLAKI